MSKRAEYLREHYPHEKGEPLVTTAQAAAITGLTTRTLLRRLKAHEIDPVRRGGHGRMLWRMNDLTVLLDIELHVCHSDG